MIHPIWPPCWSQTPHTTTPATTHVWQTIPMVLGRQPMLSKYLVSMLSKSFFIIFFYYFSSTVEVTFMIECHGILVSLCLTCWIGGNRRWGKVSDTYYLQLCTFHFCLSLMMKFPQKMSNATKYYTGQKKSLQARNSWGWSDSPIM